jgi:hypothetical protein
MPTVVAVIVCGRRAFSGAAAARVVRDVGDGRDGAMRPFGCSAIMKRARARVRLFQRLGACLSVADEVVCS